MITLAIAFIVGFVISVVLPPAMLFWGLLIFLVTALNYDRLIRGGRP